MHKLEEVPHPLEYSLETLLILQQEQQQAQLNGLAYPYSARRLAEAIRIKKKPSTSITITS